MSAKPAHLSSAAADAAPEAAGGAARTPLCFVIDTDASIRQFLSLILHGAGIDTEEFADGNALRAALARRAPDLVFLDIPLEVRRSDCVRRRARRRQLSRTGAAHERSRLGRAGACQKHRRAAAPADAAGAAKAVRDQCHLKLLQNLKLGHPPAVAGRIDLGEALSNRWIEFWYQPKIDLRKKQLVGAEAFARARHPTYGVLLPDAFMPGATEASLITLSELALSQALKAGANFAKLGVNLRMAVNIPVSALVKLAVADIVQTYRPQFEKWPGLIIDVAEEQIVTDLALATDITKKLHTSTSSSRSTISAAAIPRWCGSRICRLPNSSSTAPS